MCGYFLSLLLYHQFVAPFNQKVAFELALGGSLAMPSFWLFKRASPASYRAIDRYLGNLAYPLFICHFMGLYLAEMLFGLQPEQWWRYFATALAITLLCSVALERMQGRLERYRIARRHFGSLSG